jgi:hypothetical protein
LVGSTTASANTGKRNTALGAETLHSDTTGGFNTAVGEAALNNNTTGVSNTGIGDSALWSNKGKQNNTAVGKDAMYYADDTATSSLSNNTALGYQALYGGVTASGNTGTNNTAIGAQALMSATSGGNNVAVGEAAGDNITTGASNIIIGYNIDAPSATASQQLSIGNLIFGTGLNGAGTTISTGNVGIGTTNMNNSKFAVNGIGQTNYATFSDYSTATFLIGNDGAGSVRVHSDSAQPLKIGVGATDVMTLLSTGNVGIGTTNPAFALQLGVPTAVGTATPQTISLGGTYSSSAGNNAKLRLWTDATDVMGMGVSSNQLDYIVSSSAYDHVFYGGASESLRIKGTGNVGIGQTSPAARLHVTKSAANTQQVAAYIQNQAAATTASTQSTRLGFIPGSLYTNFETLAPYIEAMMDNVTTADSSLRFGTYNGASTTEKMIIKGNGNVGIGTTNPDQGRVEVKGGTICVDTNSDDNATSCIASESDERLKTNIAPLTGALRTLQKLRGVSFDWRVNDREVLQHYPLISRFASNPHSVGLIAQEVSPVFPYAIAPETVGDKEVQYFQLDYTKFVPLLIEAAKELKADNDDLRAELKAANENQAAETREQAAEIRELREQAAEIRELRAEIKAIKAPDRGAK